jgi:opacity protein-like surface antigen
MNAMRLAVLIGGVLAATAAQAQNPAAGQGPFIRAEAGISLPRDAKFREDNPNSPDCFLFVTGTTCGGTLDHLGGGWTGGIGVGYRFAGGIRADVSYHRHGGYNLKGWDPAGTYYDPDVKSDAVMVNGTFDLPVVMGSIRPFIGGGIGRSRNEMKPLNWNDPGCCRGTLTGGKKSDTAWQLTLGADIALDRGWTLEVLYRYMDMGKFVKDFGPDQATPTGTFSASGNTVGASGRLRSNEFILGIRRSFQ